MTQDKKVASLWAHDQFMPNEQLTITTGARVSLYEEEENLHISPKISLLWEPHKILSFKGTASIVHQFLHRSAMDDLYLEGSRYFWLLSSKNEAPVSHAKKCTGGMSFKPAGFLIDFETYFNHQEGITLYKESYSPSAADYSVGEGWSRGFDLMIQKNLKMYTGWVSYSRSRSVQQFGSEVNHGKPFTSPYDHPNEVKIVNMIDINKFTATVTWVYASGASFETPVGVYQPDFFDWTTTTFGLGGWKNSERMPDYHRLDFSTSYRFTPGKRTSFTVSGSVFNCYNRKNIRGYGFEHTLDMGGKEVNEDQIYRTESYYLGVIPSLSVNVAFKQPRRGLR